MKNSKNQKRGLANLLGYFEKSEAIEMLRDIAQETPKFRFDKKSKTRFILFCQLLEDDVRELED